jgi:hypothetical protein
MIQDPTSRERGKSNLTKLGSALTSTVQPLSLLRDPDALHGQQVRLLLPNLVIAGAPRCGTTSLFNWLAAHPQVMVSHIKETRYLVDHGYPLFNKACNFHSSGLEGYARLFPQSAALGARLCLEATPDYMYQRTALSVLADLPTNPLILFVLRNPVDRMLSLFDYAIQNVGSLDSNISAQEYFVASRDAVFEGDEIIKSAFAHSIYYLWLEQWIARVGRSRVAVYFFDDLVNNPRGFMQQICARVNIDGEFYSNFEFKPANQTYRVRSMKLTRAKRSVQRLVPVSMRRGILEWAYRAINVRAKTWRTVPDIGLLQEMRACFAEPNRRLALLLEQDLPTSWL